MSISAISKTPSFKGKYTVKINDNKHLKLLTNHLCDLVKKEHLTATFSRDFIEINTLTVQQDKNVQNTLKELLVKYLLKK